MTEEKIIALCDASEAYLLGMADALSGFLKRPYVLYTFTSIEKVFSFLENQKLYMLLASESAMGTEDVKRAKEISDMKLLILSEEGKLGEEDICIDKFRPCEEVIRDIVFQLSEQQDFVSIGEKRSRGWKVVGFYSPIKRCLQSSFALSLGQLLAAKRKVLYLSFENFPIISGFQNQNMQGDITDLLYYFDCDSDKFLKKLPLLTKSINGLDYLPPSGSYFDTYDRTGKRWIEFFEMLEKHTGYEVLLLDLTDGMTGLLDVLEYCDKIYTIGKEDSFAKGKMLQYESWMKEHAFAGIMEKTTRFCFPRFENMTQDISLLMHGELAGYARAVIREDLCG